MQDCVGIFRRESVNYLREIYLPRIDAALRELPEGDLGWRPHDRSLSAETILTHLEGNVRQWILSGIGGQPDRRDRASEFKDPQGRSGKQLLARLRTTVDEAARVIESLGVERLSEEFEIQGFRTTGIAAIYHVIEHFSWHTGQLVWIAKARAGAGHGVAFYDDDAINAARNRRP